MGGIFENVLQSGRKAIRRVDCRARETGCRCGVILVVLVIDVVIICSGSSLAA